MITDVMWDVLGLDGERMWGGVWDRRGIEMECACIRTTLG